jgi:hypothetical protein
MLQSSGRGSCLPHVLPVQCTLAAASEHSCKVETHGLQLRWQLKCQVDRGCQQPRFCTDFGLHKLDVESVDDMLLADSARYQSVCIGCPA